MATDRKLEDQREAAQTALDALYMTAQGHRGDAERLTRERDEARADAERLRALLPPEAPAPRVPPGAVEALEQHVQRVREGEALMVADEYAHNAAIDAMCESPAPGSAEWVATAPLDEVRAWLRERGVLGLNGWTLYLATADGRFEVKLDEAAALRALAAQVAKEADGGE